MMRRGCVMNIRVVEGLVINLDKFNVAYRDDKGVLHVMFDSGDMEISQRDGADDIEAFLKGQAALSMREPPPARTVATMTGPAPVDSQAQVVMPNTAPLTASDLADPHGVTVPLAAVNIARSRGFVPAIMPDKNAQ